MSKKIKFEKIDLKGLKQDILNKGENYPKTLQTLADMLNYGFDFNQDPVLRFCVRTYLATGEIEKRGDKYYSNGPNDVPFSSMEDIKGFFSKLGEDEIFEFHEEKPRKNDENQKLYNLRPDHTID